MANEETNDNMEMNLIHCRDCKYFVFDVWQDYHWQDSTGEYLTWPLVVDHEICYRWNEDGNKTDVNGYCYLAEKRD